MHFMFMIEDQSTEVLVRKVMGYFTAAYSNITFDCKSFKGIRGFTFKNTVKETKSGKLLNDLATYMRGFDKSLQGIRAAIIVVVDNDDRNTEEFRNSMEKVAEDNNIKTDHVFCIAVEEMEAWLLGDAQAIKQAYPKAKLNILHNYEQDSICDTWEFLADVIYPGGRKKMKKLPYGEIGRQKSIWANDIGTYMDFDNNSSPSFHSFLNEIRSRVR